MSIQPSGEGSRSSDPWAGLSHDPRLPEHAHLRAADRDRDAVAQVLAEAFADGRLSREEYDERSEQLLASKTLGELPGLVKDLVSPTPYTWPAAGVPGVPTGTAVFREQALAKYRRERAAALWSMVSASMICFVIWTVLGLDVSAGTFEPSFPWPLIVLAATGANYLRLVVQRRQVLDDEVRRLERKAARRQQRRGPA